MSSEHINLQSPDAMFASVLAELKGLQGAICETRDIMRRLEAQVLVLERENIAMRSKVVGGVVALSSVIGFVAWLIQQGFTQLFTSTK